MINRMPIAARLAVLVALVVIAAAAVFLATRDGNAEDRAVIISSGGSHIFEIELVDTPETRARGLMFRDSLAPDAGMLFDYHTEQHASFWMQNTLIPLDMIFIKADGAIVKVHANAQPMDTTSIPSGEPVRFVLEIAGGRAAELGIAPGDRLEHPRVQ